jgi:hypothetical protein
VSPEGQALRQSNFRLEIKRSNNKEVNIVNSVHPCTIAIIFFHVTLSMAAVVWLLLCLSAIESVTVGLPELLSEMRNVC